MPDVAWLNHLVANICKYYKTDLINKNMVQVDLVGGFFTNPSAKYAHQNGNHLLQVVVKIKTCCQKHHADTVDRRHPAAVEVGILSHLSPWFAFFISPRWCRISSINSTTKKKSWWIYDYITNGLGCFHQFRRCFLFNDSYIASVWDEEIRAGWLSQ